MFKYPEGLYVDVRIEETFDTRISFKKEVLHEQKVRIHHGAFIRLFDGQRWYYASTTDTKAIQKNIDELAKMAQANASIMEHPIVKAFEVNQETILQYEARSLSHVPVQEKRDLLASYLPLLNDACIVHHSSTYIDNKTIKSIYSSKGTAVTFDKQSCGILLRMDLAEGDKKDQSAVTQSKIYFEDLAELKSYFSTEISKNIHFVRHAIPITAGDYPVLLSPLATGVFTHESFGHKSEADFMVGDEAMKKEWALGKTIGPSLLSIVDDGTVKGTGYVPYDDEGSKGKKTYLITRGELSGRLHSASTAAQLQEPLTGNARAMNFEYEPIVRMTCTYIEKGERPLSEIIAEMDQGIFVDTIKHGSGMSTFTIAPARAYMIEKGKIAQPVKISVLTGNVFQTLADVDAVSREFELMSFVGGGCGKMEQWPLPVGFGGPYTRVKKLKAQ